MGKIVMTPQTASSLEGEDLVVACREIALEINRLLTLQAVVSERIQQESGYFEDREGLAQSYGCRSAVELIQRLTGESARTVSSRLKVGYQVTVRRSLLGEELPPLQEHVAAGLETGVLNFESAAHVSSLLEKNRLLSDPADLEVAERCLVQAATGLDFGGEGGPSIPLHADDIRHLCVKWDQALDPDGNMPSEYVRQSRRGVSLGPVRNGLARLTGYLTSEAAAAFAAVADSLNNPRASKAAGTADALVQDHSDDSARLDSEGLDSQVSEESSEPTDTRTRAQKDHDALATALNVALASRELPLLQGANATIVVEVKEEHLRDFGESDSDPLVGWLVDHRGTQTPVRRSLVNHLSCGAQIQTVVRNSLGKIVALGTPTRIFGPNQRRAIALRDGGCVIPGCTVPPAWCEIHHVTPHSDGGPTHTDNGVTLCRFHHRTIDSSGWQIQMRGGIPYVRPPRWVADLFPENYESGWANQAAANQEARIQEALESAQDSDEPWIGASESFPEARFPDVNPPDADFQNADFQNADLPDANWLSDMDVLDEAPESGSPPTAGLDPPGSWRSA